MEKHYKAVGTIRGTRYSILLIKRVKGMPGFAPEYRDREVCEVVFNFPHGDGETYMDFRDNPPNLTIADMEEILSLAKSDFDEKDFPFESADKILSPETV